MARVPVSHTKTYLKDCYTVNYLSAVMSWLIRMTRCRASYLRAVIHQAKTTVSTFLLRVFHYHSWIPQAKTTGRQIARLQRGSLNRVNTKRNKSIVTHEAKSKQSSFLHESPQLSLAMTDVNDEA